MPSTFYKIRLILGDQLNQNHSWYEQKEADVLYVMMECLSETNYVRHHIQKVTGFFLAMRAFAQLLETEGHNVYYLRLDDPHNQETIAANIIKLVQQHQPKQFEYQLPDEYRLDRALAKLRDQLDIETKVVDTEHFLSTRTSVAELFAGKKQFLMETFYRKIRKQYNLLMEDNGTDPLTGRWNYDQENRKKLPKQIGLPEPLHFSRDVSDVVKMLNRKEVKTIGDIQEDDFQWPVTREECLAILDHFLQHSLRNFGLYQDALTDRNYLLFHSKLSFGLNIKLLHPLEVVQKSIAYWEAHQEEINIAQIEGFVRQIIGWREYMRGIYWAKMPEFSELNYFEHEAGLPDFYWTGDTKMACMKQAIGQSLQHAYAHHIQRLMVTGNFALLLGVHPDAVDEWYLGIYMDAIQWVEITNTRGMSQYADGGIVGTKPYVSSANYIHKMGDHCKQCHYSHTKKYGEGACPFNSLYWDFYDRHRDKLSKNPRVGMMYRVWDKMDSEEKVKILEQAAAYKANASEL